MSDVEKDVAGGGLDFKTEISKERAEEIAAEIATEMAADLAVSPTDEQAKRLAAAKGEADQGPAAEGEADQGPAAESANAHGDAEGDVFGVVGEAEGLAAEWAAADDSPTDGAALDGAARLPVHGFIMDQNTRKKHAECSAHFGSHPAETFDRDEWVYVTVSQVYSNCDVLLWHGDGDELMAGDPLSAVSPEYFIVIPREWFSEKINHDADNADATHTTDANATNAETFLDKMLDAAGAVIHLSSEERGKTPTPPRESISKSNETKSIDKAQKHVKEITSELTGASSGKSGAISALAKLGRSPAPVQKPHCACDTEHVVGDIVQLTSGYTCIEGKIDTIETTFWF